MKLPRKVTIHDASMLASTLRQALSAGVAMRIDASDVEHIDACSLQLLCSAQKTSPGATITSPSESFLGAVHRCGLEHVLLHTSQEAA